VGHVSADHDTPPASHFGGGGWISGACTNPARPTAALPVYNPSRVVLEVQALLGRAGIDVVIDIAGAPHAVAAAGDLLRALGVSPGTQAR
jgi:hypothetical protein